MVTRVTSLWDSVALSRQLKQVVIVSVRVVDLRVRFFHVVMMMAGYEDAKLILF